MGGRTVRLFVDANVLIGAAHRAESHSGALLAWAEKNTGCLIASPYVLSEARHNLWPKRLLPRLERLLEAVTAGAECSPENAAWAREQGLPGKDAPILGAAAQAGADLLVTSDRMHFGHLYGRTLRGVQVATPGEARTLLLT